VQPRRVDSSQRNPWQHGSTREDDQGCTFSLETLAGEFTVVASLKALISLQAEGNQKAHSRRKPVRRWV